MKFLTFLAITAVPCVLAPASAQEFADYGDFLLEFREAPMEGNAEMTARDYEIRELLMDDQALYDLMQDVNEDVKLPKDILVIFGPGTPEASYDTAKDVVYLSYSFVDMTINLFRRNGSFNDDDYWGEVNSKILPVVDETILHEIGHALIDVHQIPLEEWDNEEELADQLAFYIIHDFYDSSDDLMAVALHYRYRANESEPSEYDSEHPADIERHDNYLCWIYGSDRKKFSGFEGQLGELTEECEDRYHTVMQLWDDKPFWQQ
jgi:hypothetical protein